MLGSDMSRLSQKSSADTGWSMETVDYLYLEGVSWELYEHLLKVVGTRPLHLTYDNGELEIMSPLPEHENAGRMIGRLIEEITQQLDVPAIGLKSTTFRRKLKKRGLEPDECFYIKSQPKLVGRKRIALPKDPPPDLAVEVDVTHRSIDRLPIYAALGVPEIWRFHSGKLECLLLEKNTYRAVEYGLAFPQLRVGDLARFVRLAEESFDHTGTIKAFRVWMKRQSWMKTK